MYRTSQQFAQHVSTGMSHTVWLMGVWKYELWMVTTVVGIKYSAGKVTSRKIGSILFRFWAILETETWPISRSLFVSCKFYSIKQSNSQWSSHHDSFWYSHSIQGSTHRLVRAPMLVSVRGSLIGTKFVRFEIVPRCISFWIHSSRFDISFERIRIDQVSWINLK